MNNSKIARLTGSLLARKGEAKPAASVVDFNVSGRFNRPVEVGRGTPATHPVAAPDTARPAAGHPFSALSAERATPAFADVDPDTLPDPDKLLRQLTNHGDFQSLDSTGVPQETGTGSSGPANRSRRHALTVRLDPDRYQRFKIMARVGGRTNQEILLDALNQYLDAGPPDGTGPQRSETHGFRDTEISAIAAELGAIRALIETLMEERRGNAAAPDPAR